MPRKPKEAPHLRVRIEPRLLERLERARAKSGRTLTGEIVSRLEETFLVGERLRERLERDAAKNGRSVSAEIVARLEQAFYLKNTTDLIHATVLETLDQLEQRRRPVPLSRLGSASGDEGPNHE
jgi:Arc-like DNA binding domain